MIKSRLYNTFGLLLIGFIECMHMYETFNKIKFDIQRLDYRWPRPAFQLLKTVSTNREVELLLLYSKNEGYFRLFRGVY